MLKNNIFTLLCIFFIPICSIAKKITPPLSEIKTGAPITSFDYSPDGSKVIIGSKSKEISVWDVATSRLIQTFKGHTDNILSVKYSHNGRFAASGGADNTLILWDAVTGDIIHKSNAHNDYICDLAFSPDNKLIVTASWDKTAIVWDLGTFKQLVRLDANGNDIYSVCFNASGSKLVTSSSDKFITFWETATWKKITTFKSENNNKVWDVNFSNNGQYLVAGMGNEAAIWSIKEATLIASFKQQNGNIRNACFSNDDQLLVTCGDENTVTVWDIATGLSIVEFLGNHATFAVNAIRFSPDGSKITAASSDGYLRTYEVPTMPERRNAFVRQKMKIWKAQNEHELLLTESAQAEIAAAKDFDQKIIDFFEKNIKWATLSIKNYDAEEEVYYLTSPTLGTLFFRIEPKEAEQFKANFDKLTIKKPTFLTGHNGVYLDFVEINIPMGNDIKAYLLLSR